MLRSRTGARGIQDLRPFFINNTKRLSNALDPRSSDDALRRTEPRLFGTCASEKGTERKDSLSRGTVCRRGNPGRSRSGQQVLKMPSMMQIDATSGTRRAASVTGSVRCRTVSILIPEGRAINWDATKAWSHYCRWSSAHRKSKNLPGGAGVRAGRWTPIFWIRQNVHLGLPPRMGITWRWSSGTFSPPGQFSGSPDE